MAGVSLRRCGAGVYRLPDLFLTDTVLSLYHGLSLVLPHGPARTPAVSRAGQPVVHSARGLATSSPNYEPYHATARPRCRPGPDGRHRRPCFSAAAAGAG